MKTLFTIALLIFCLTTTWAQTQIIKDLDQLPSSLTIDGNTIYVAGYSEIYTIDLTKDPIEAVKIIDGLDLIRGLLVNGDDLYVAQYSKLSVIDLSASTLSATDLVTNLQRPTALYLDGNDLYFAEANPGRLNKIDITQTNPTSTLIAENVGGDGVVKYNNAIYTTRYGSRRIIKIDLSDTSVTDFLRTERSPSGTVLLGDHLFWTELDGDADGLGRVMRINLADTSATADSVFGGMDRSWSIVASDCNLYVSDDRPRAIYRFAVDSAIDITTTRGGDTITANKANATYQWIDCSNNAAISGEDSQSFTPTSSGDYAVVVSYGSCSDTSDCVNVTIVGEDEITAFKDVSLYPNPTKGQVNVSLGKLKNVSVRVYDIRGQVIHHKVGINTANYAFDMEGYSTGLYIVELTGNNTRQQYKLMVD